ncbi:NIF3-like protein-like protein [Cristinia sonorae]|uniref:NIF3-like protein-like protein n=1 Tax=Cristinia sonorae TaxID=1940300 RepID=A0A8K0UJG2_9AGAR|nr:NIF3-like protein-like protein [Cristinia sonorae]
MAVSIVKSVCKAMEAIAPLRLAEKWDNVGLLLEAPVPRPSANRVLLTIDVTAAVTEEALSSPTSVIVSYHPVIFHPLKSFTLSNPLQSNLLRLASSGISVYSPHTSLDSVWGGINDWLGSGIVEPPETKGQLKEWKVRLIGEEAEGGIGGTGRVFTLAEPVSMKEMERRIKLHLGLQHIQVGYPQGKSPEEPSIKSVAICAGSGESLLDGVDADLYFTGEMPHHSVLAAVANGRFVALCGHTNTERGYLPVLAENLKAQFQTDAQAANPDVASVLRSLEVHVSKTDKHPLEIV